MLTFQTKKSRQFGCGIYLCTSSIISIILSIVLIIKFWFLLTSQMGLIDNLELVYLQCIIIDYILRTLLSISDWLSACVAVERALNVSKGAYFNKTKSKQIAKWIILSVFLFTIASHLHDPIHRRLMEDEEGKRIWCVTKYSLLLQMYNSILNVIHFAVPFAINCISTLIIIFTAARSRSNA
jgi:hypothetical protein